MYVFMESGRFKKGSLFCTHEDFINFGLHYPPFWFSELSGWLKHFQQKLAFGDVLIPALYQITCNIDNLFL